MKSSGCGDAASIIAGDVRQFGRRVPYAEMVARIDAITKKEIQAVSPSTSRLALFFQAEKILLEERNVYHPNGSGRFH